MPTRRSFLRAIAAAPFACAGHVVAQSRPGQVFRVGYLANDARLADIERGTATWPGFAAFVEGLRERGWEDGKNIRIVWKSAEGMHPRLPDLANELVHAGVDVIVAAGPGANAAANTTRSIPIVTAGSYAPTASGLAESLARPGRNVTGLALDPTNPMPKMLSLLKEAAPSTAAVAVVGQARSWAADGHPVFEDWERFKEPGRRLGIELSYMTFGDAATIPVLMQSAVRQGANALLFENPPPLHLPENQVLIATEQKKHRLPVIVPVLPAAANGVLMAYGSDTVANSRLSARYVDRILRGERPATMPMEQPRGLSLHINRDAARAIGLEIPPTLLLQADHVIG